MNSEANTDLVRHVLELIEVGRDRCAFCTVIAITPVDAVQLHRLRSPNLAFAWSVNRPDPDKVAHAFAVTSELLGGPLLEERTQQWLALIARAQNWPGPISTIGSRVLKSDTGGANKANPRPTIAKYSNSISIDTELRKLWESTLDLPWGLERNFSMDIGKSESECHGRLAIVAGWPGSGRLLSAQLVFRSLLERSRESEPVPHSFHRIDLTQCTPEHTLSDENRELLLSSLKTERAFVYVDLSGSGPIDTDANDLVRNTGVATEAFDLLKLCSEHSMKHERPLIEHPGRSWTFGWMNARRVAQRSSAPTETSEPTYDWRADHDVPKGFMFNRHINRYHIRGIEKLLADDVVSGFLSYVDSIRLTAWDDGVDTIVSEQGGVTLLAARDAERVKFFFRRLTQATGRAVFRLTPAEYQEGGLWLRRLRDFVLTHRHGIVWLDDVVNCPNEWLSTSELYGHAKLAIRAFDGQLTAEFEVEAERMSWDWAPGARAPFLDWQSLERIWVFGTIPLPLNFPQEAIIPNLCSFSKTPFAAAFPESQRERVAYILRRWEFIYYLPSPGETRATSSAKNVS
jgi:hypothetical protein